MARARARPRSRRPPHRAERRHDARLRRPGVEAFGPDPRGGIRVGVERDRDDHRRRAGVRAGALGRRARVGRRGPLRGAPADRCARDRRRRPDLLAVQVLRTAPGDRLRARLGARDAGARTRCDPRRTTRSAGASRPGPRRTSCWPDSTRRSTTCDSIGGFEAIVPYERSLGQRFLDARRRRTRSPCTGCRRWRGACRRSSSTSTASPPRPSSSAARRAARSACGRTTPGTR